MACYSHCTAAERLGITESEVNDLVNAGELSGKSVCGLGLIFLDDENVPALKKAAGKRRILKEVNRIKAKVKELYG